MNETSRGNRLQIGFFGTCNAGKSTAFNLMLEQEVAVTSQVLGTTTDPVKKTMEILPLGPVTLIDTAGFDDMSDLAKKRIAKTKSVLATIDLVIFVIPNNRLLTDLEKEYLDFIKNQNKHMLILINDFSATESTLLTDVDLQKYNVPIITVDLTKSSSRDSLLTFIGSSISIENKNSLLNGLVITGKTIVLVCPLDESAPKGRLILPQVQVLREILDNHGIGIVTQVEELAGLINRLPNVDLVITDSQVFKLVDSIVPAEIPLTSFSILFARSKGDLQAFVTGIKALSTLSPDAKVLISEACTHTEQCDDIGRVQIPRLLRSLGYEKLQIQWSFGNSFPESLTDFSLIIHCGGCMLTPKEMEMRLLLAKEAGVPIINYGLFLAFFSGVFERATALFKDELKMD